MRSCCPTWLGVREEQSEVSSCTSSIGRPEQHSTHTFSHSRIWARRCSILSICTNVSRSGSVYYTSENPLTPQLKVWV